MQNWKPCDPPQLPSCQGRFVRIDTFDPAGDAAGLFAAIGGEANDDLWRYIPFGPFESSEGLGGVFSVMREASGWQPLIFRDATSGDILGTSSYMRIRPEVGSAEVGCVIFSPALKKTPAATEAMFLMAKHLFDDLGYRRYEWKCDNDNAASKNAALRFGFEFEGVFRQDLVVKGRNRDTAWFSMLDREWPVLRGAFEQWLAPENFDTAGQQRQRLAELQAQLS